MDRMNEITSIYIYSISISYISNSKYLMKERPEFYFFFLLQVDQYYSTLPSEEVPKLGSKGEMIRSQRIVRQLPKQDLSLSACKFVEPEYASSYQVNKMPHSFVPIKITGQRNIIRKIVSNIWGKWLLTEPYLVSLT